jgi:transaldolase
MIDFDKIKIFADGADLLSIRELAADPRIKGFTTNPTLMRKSGVNDYKNFAYEVLATVSNRPVSFEVLADDFNEMERQAHIISSWGDNVNVKIPITNTSGELSTSLIRRLSSEQIKLNITAILTLDQVQRVADVLDPNAPTIISVFAGRVADTGRDPVPLMSACAQLLADNPNVELLWASPRELMNIIHAEEAGCHIITISQDILRKLSLLGKDLDVYSLETVKMFYRDALDAGYNVDT